MKVFGVRIATLSRDCLVLNSAPACAYECKALTMSEIS